VWTWGRGREGQLGYSCPAGCAIPRPVGALRGRHVLQARPGGAGHAPSCLVSPAMQVVQT